MMAIHYGFNYYAKSHLSGCAIKGGYNRIRDTSRIMQHTERIQAE
jgi:hypothetical protein